MSMHNELSITGTDLVPVTSFIDVAIVDVEPPPGGSFIELPGPRKQPRRPYLELFAGPAGVAARVIRGDGKAQPLAVLVGNGGHQVVTLPGQPLAVAARSNGLWALYRDRLMAFDRAGSEQLAVDVAANHLVAATGDAAWVMSLDQVWYVDASGGRRGPYEWSGDLRSIASGDRLCALAKQAPYPVRCLAPGGEASTISLPEQPQPFEMLLALGDGVAISHVGSNSVYWYSDEGSPDELAIRGAGMEASGRGFVASLVSGQGQRVSVQVEGGAEYGVSVPEQPAMKAPVYVVAMDGERVLLHSRERAMWLDNGAIERSIDLDEASYRSEVFPHAWSLAPTRPLAALADGTVLISTTGPAGMALVRIARPKPALRSPHQRSQHRG